MGNSLVLLSGGVDSSVCLFLAARERGAGSVSAVTFDWGQLAWPQEREASAAVCRAAGVDPPRFVTIAFPYGGLLTGGDGFEARGSDPGIAPGDDRGAAFFPGRNLVMLSYAFGLAAVGGAGAVYFGAGEADQAAYHDCRPGFIAAMEEAGNSALGGRGIALLAPLVDVAKAEIVRLGRELGVPLGSTFSCYTPREGAPCGACEACRQRAGLGI